MKIASIKGTFVAVLATALAICFAISEETISGVFGFNKSTSSSATKSNTNDHDNEMPFLPTASRTTAGKHVDTMGSDERKVTLIPIPTTPPLNPVLSTPAQPNSIAAAPKSNDNRRLPLPLAAPATSCKKFGVGPYAYRELILEREGELFKPIPLDMTVNACFESMELNTESLRVGVQLGVLVRDLQQTIAAISGASCPVQPSSKSRKVEKQKDDKDWQAQKDKNSKPVEFAYKLSDVKIDTDTKVLDRLQHHVNINFRVEASPCDYTSIGGLKVNLTHTTLSFDATLPIEINLKTLDISPGKPEVKYIGIHQPESPKHKKSDFTIWGYGLSDIIPPGYSTSERIIGSFDDIIGLDQIKIVSDTLSKMVKDQITGFLDENDPDNESLRTYFHLGSTYFPPNKSISERALNNFQITKLQIFTKSGTFNFDVSLSGEIPKPFVESHRALLDSSLRLIAAP